MRASIDQRGMLIVTPESNEEAWALTYWSDNSMPMFIDTDLRFDVDGNPVIIAGGENE